MYRFAFMGVLACLAFPAFGQQALEIIPLRHRLVEQVFPVLQPLVEPGGTLTGQSNQLIVRTSPRNLAEIRAALEVIDRPLRRLQISVRFHDASDHARDAVSASGQVSERSARLEVRGRGERSAATEQVEQRIQVLEGGRAFITTGQSRTLPQRQLIQTPGGIVAQETIVVQQLETGFDVIPRLSGGAVLLDIGPQRQTVRARLGEWTELGGSTRAATRDSGTLASASRSSATEDRRVWLKVEALD